MSVGIADPGFRKLGGRQLETDVKLELLAPIPRLLPRTFPFRISA
jgi:hypothetical protein